MKIINACDAVDNPNVIIANGIQAMGGIGRIISIIGLIMPSKNGFIAIAIPKGIAMMNA